MFKTKTQRWSVRFKGILDLSSARADHIFVPVAKTEQTLLQETAGGKMIGQTLMMTCTKKATLHTLQTCQCIHGTRSQTISCKVTPEDEHKRLSTSPGHRDQNCTFLNIYFSHM